jgi:hypothetical protein
VKGLISHMPNISALALLRIHIPKVVASLQLWVEISERIRRNCSNLRTDVLP